MSIRSLVAVLLLVGGVAERVSAQKIIRVPDDYPTVQGAVNAARDGDTIFLMPGVRDLQSTVIRKSLTFLGNGSVFFGRFLNVRGPITIRGLGLVQAYASALNFESCTGPILIQDSKFANVSAKHCPSVTVTHCVMRGAWGNLFINTHLAVWDSTVTGLKNNHGGLWAGLDLRDGSLFVSGCSIQGPDGRDAHWRGAPRYCFPGTRGGDGLRFSGKGTATIVGCTIAAGKGGLSYCTGSKYEPPGKRITNAGWPLREIQGPMRRLLSLPIARPGKSWKLEVETQKNDVLVLGLGLNQNGVVVPNVLGRLDLSLGSAILWAAGTRQGKTSIQLTMPKLPSGRDSLDVFLQGLVGTANGLVWTNPAGLTLLHPKF